jgi:hypothetical protein
MALWARYGSARYGIAVRQRKPVDEVVQERLSSKLFHAAWTLGGPRGASSRSLHRYERVVATFPSAMTAPGGCAHPSKPSSPASSALETFSSFWGPHLIGSTSGHLDLCLPRLDHVGFTHPGHVRVAEHERQIWSRTKPAPSAASNIGRRLAVTSPHPGRSAALREGRSGPFTRGNTPQETGSRWHGSERRHGHSPIAHRCSPDPVLHTGCSIAMRRGWAPLHNGVRWWLAFFTSTCSRMTWPRLTQSRRLALRIPNDSLRRHKCSRQCPIDVD